MISRLFPLLDVHHLDHARVPDPVQRHDAVPARAVAHLLGVLRGGGQDLVGRVRVRRARRPFRQQRQQAAGHQRLARGLLARAPPGQRVGRENGNGDGQNGDRGPILRDEASGGAATGEDNDEGGVDLVGRADGRGGERLERGHGGRCAADDGAEEAVVVEARL